MRGTFLQHLNSKNALLKRSILELCINEGGYSIADLSKELNTSIPTTTKLVGELIDEGFLEDRGKQDTNGGRRPSVYGLNPDAGFFIGVDVRKNDLNIALMDFKGAIIEFMDNVPFSLEANEKSVEEFCKLLKTLLAETDIQEDKIRAYGFNLTGRVNHTSGYSFSYFLGEDKPITDVLENLLDTPVFIDNDSRGMAYGEYMCGVGNNERDMLFINISMGLGMGMIIDGKLSYGKSGFSGEIGHCTILDNDKICRCGKIGCLETGASGWALKENFIRKLEAGRASSLSELYEQRHDINIQEILDAALDEEDVLAIECIEEIGHVLGRAVASLINLFNPELVVIGGTLAKVKDYLMIPLKGAINKYSLTLVHKDTTVKFSKLGEHAGPVGACVLSRSKLLGLI